MEVIDLSLIGFMTVRGSVLISSIKLPMPEKRPEERPGERNERSIGSFADTVIFRCSCFLSIFYSLLVGVGDGLVRLPGLVAGEGEMVGAIVGLPPGVVVV
jgi:hypothetical protein